MYNYYQGQYSEATLSLEARPPSTYQNQNYLGFHKGRTNPEPQQNLICNLERSYVIYRHLILPSNLQQTQGQQSVKSKTVTHFLRVSLNFDPFGVTNSRATSTHDHSFTVPNSFQNLFIKKYINFLCIYTVSLMVCWA